MERRALRGIRFDTKNADKVVEQLNDLSDEITSKILSFSLTKNNYRIAKSKYEDGISILRSLDENNPMLKIFENKIGKWNETNTKNTIIRIVSWAGIGIGGIVFIAIGLASS